MKINKVRHVVSSTVDSHKFQLFLQHLKFLVNHHEPSYEFMLNVLAHLFQKPGEAMNVIMIFYSEKCGVGKNTFFETLVGNMMLGKRIIFTSRESTNVIW